MVCRSTENKLNFGIKELSENKSMLPYVPPNSVQINQIIYNHVRSVCFVVYCYNTQGGKSQCSPQINIYVNYKKGALFHFDFFI